MKGSSPSFLDTNILIYAFSDDRRQAIARNLVETGGVISVQCLNEFVNVCRGRLRLSWPVIEQYVSSIRELCPDVQAIDVETHSEAVRIARQFGLHVYDATIVASALRSGCEILFTEDMHDGLFIDGRLRVKNPFRNV